MVTLVALAIVLPSHPATAATTAAGGFCAPVFIGVPGFGQHNGVSPEVNAIYPSITQSGGALQSQQTVNYDATDLWRYLLPTRNFDNLDASEKQGESVLLTMITAARNAASRNCASPDVPIMLAGYSQDSRRELLGAY